MHPLIYSCKLVEIPRNLARFGLKPGDQLDLRKVEERVEVHAKPNGLIAWMFGGTEPVGQIDETHCRRLRPFMEEECRFARVIGFAEDITLGEVLDLPDIANEVIHNLCEQLMALHKRGGWYEERLKQVAKEDARVRLLRTIPGVGAVTASAIIASIGDGHQFRNGREFAAWLGLTPANKSSGGKEKLGRITTLSADLSSPIRLPGNGWATAICDCCL